MTTKEVKPRENDGKRYRNFATVVYPESASEDWFETLGEQCIPCFVSPLHDSDVNPGGEIKKAHYHVLFTFDGKKSVEQIRSIVDKINGVGVETVQSLRGYARYLCHLDNPEKFQYKTDDVRCFGGVDYTSAIGLPTDKYKAIGEMIDFCKENEVYSYSELLEYARECKFDWFRVLCDSGTVVMKEYLKSRSWTHDAAELNRSKLNCNLKTSAGMSVNVHEYIGESVERINDGFIS